MLKVRDLMSSDVIGVSPELTLRAAIELLAAQHISGAPVVAERQVVGVLSASDVLGFEAETPGVPTERTDQLEQGELEGPDEWTAEGTEAPAAYFSELWADVGADVSERISELDTPEWDVLEEHTVSEVMSRGVLAVSPDAEVAEAAQCMLTHGVHRVLVLDQGRLVGILTGTDIVRAVAERRL
ncbi:MAG TPA: CBS domain-containing protein [Gemmatimonadales bacterium]|nr:CBS domain-containing protein [Gemmatimonadales bacterium]